MELEDVTKEDFVDWKRSKVTTAYFLAVEEGQKALEEQLIRAAGENPTNDRYLAGYIQAMKDLKGVELDELPTDWESDSVEAESGDGN